MINEEYRKTILEAPGRCRFVLKNMLENSSILKEREDLEKAFETFPDLEHVLINFACNYGLIERSEDIEWARAFFPNSYKNETFVKKGREVCEYWDRTRQGRFHQYYTMLAKSLDTPRESQQNVEQAQTSYTSYL